MNKKIYIGIYSVSLGWAWVIGFPCLLLAVFHVYALNIAYRLGLEASYVIISLWVVLIVSYLQFAAVHIIYTFITLAKMWGSIQDGQATITVGKAIGYMFIPFFNIYWVFVAWGSFPTEFNRYIDRHRLSVPHISGGVFVAYPVVLLLTAVLLMPLAILPFVFSGVIAKACDAVNNLGRVVQGRSGSAA